MTAYSSEPRRLEIVVKFFSEGQREEILRFKPGTCVGEVRKRLAAVIQAPGDGRALSIRLYSLGLGRYLSDSECEDGCIMEPGSYTAPCSEVNIEEGGDEAAEEDNTWPLARVYTEQTKQPLGPIPTRQGSPAGIGALVVILGVTIIVLLVITIFLLA